MREEDNPKFIETRLRQGLVPECYLARPPTAAERLEGLRKRLRECCEPHVTREHRTLLIGEDDARLLLSELSHSEAKMDKPNGR